MTKYYQFFAAAALLGLSLVSTSCSEEDNPAESEGYKVTVTVNTADMYEQLGIADELTALLADEPEEDFGVGVSLFLYDTSGKLVDSEDGEGIRHDLQPTKVEMDELENGTYSLLVVQNVTYQGEEGLFLDVEKEEQFGTIEMWNRFMSEVPATYAFGYKLVPLTIKDGDAEVTVTPDPAGSVVEFSLEGLDKTDYGDIFLITEDVPACIAPDDKPEELDLVRQYRTFFGKQKGIVAHFDLTREHDNALKRKFFIMNMAGKIQFQIIGMNADVDDDVIAEGELDVKLGGQNAVGYNWNTNTSYWGVPQ